MRALLQRVISAQVIVGGEVVGKIGKGLVVLVGVSHDDFEEDAWYLADKTVNLRVFEDSQSKFNLSVLDVGGELLTISQFTLLANSRKGRRPSFADAALPDRAEAIFNYFVARANDSGLRVETGRFRQHMMVEIHNDGPVTVMLDSKERMSPRRG